MKCAFFHLTVQILSDFKYFDEKKSSVSRRHNFLKVSASSVKAERTDFWAFLHFHWSKRFSS